MVRRIGLLGLVGCLASTFAYSQEIAKQVNVSVKIVEFQTSDSRETGLSAYFRRRNKERAFGRVTSGNGAILNADLTFPTDTGAGITVFLDRIRMSEGDLEVVLQALEDQNRAFILSRPSALVTVGSATPTEIKTTQAIPYENTQVVGATAVQITSFRDTGVTLNVSCPQLIDDDNNPNTKEDIYIQLNVTAQVIEEGQRITIALDDMVAGGIFEGGNNAIDVPEFVSRSVRTSVWVRHDQVLILGGLYRNTKNKSIATLPWLMQGEDMVFGAVDRIVPADVPTNPLSSVLGNRATSESRRELVFLIKATLWRPAYTVSDDFGFEEDEAAEGARLGSPTDVVTEVIEGITDIPKAVAEKVAGDAPRASDAGGAE